MTPRPVSDLIAALGLFGEVVADLAGRDFDVVTRCTPWSVYDVANHVAAVTMKFTMFASGETDLPRTPRGDVLAGDPVSGFEAAARASQLAWESVDPTRRCHLPFGVFPALEAATARSRLCRAWQSSPVVEMQRRLTRHACLL